MVFFRSIIFKLVFILVIGLTEDLSHHDLLKSVFKQIRIVIVTRIFVITKVCALVYTI